jgi:glycosyltransferase involved in cell wall biosynthesis
MERAVYHLARHLEARGVETLLVTRPATETGSFPGAVVSVPYRSWPAGAHGGVLDRTLNYPGFSRRVGERVAALVRAGRIDLVDAQGLTALGYGRLRARHGLRAPLVMNPQGMEEHKTRGLKRLALLRLRRLSREAARLADRVVATDEATRAEVPALLGVEASRVAVVPNGIDPGEIQAATPSEPRAFAERALPSLVGRSPLVLSVGRIEGYKGFGDALAALSLLRRGAALPESLAWVVVGDGPARRTLEADARAAGFAPAGPATAGPAGGPLLVLPGRVPEPLLHGLYASADVFLHTTRYEGSSLVTLEAMAHGLPVVATRAGGIPDKVLDGETGRLVEPGDAAGCATALRELLADAGLAGRMAANGRALVLERFSWPVIVTRVLSLYETLLAEARQ